MMAHSQVRASLAVVIMAASLTIVDARSAGMVGEAAPAIEVRDARGERLRIGDLKGKVVVIDLWASWCEPCRASFPALDSLYREYRERGVEVIAVNVDDRRKNADAFLAASPHEMRVAFDPRARILTALRAPGIPSSYVIDRNGLIRYIHEGQTSELHSDYRREIETLLAEPARQVR